MSLLSAHLEQITLSCQGIESLPFPPPKIFTNALLANHDITSLIRDTEAHERALFSVPPPPPLATSHSLDPPNPSNRRQTVFNVAGGEVTTGPPPDRLARGAGAAAPRRHTAVAAVLGGDLHAKIVRRGAGGSEGGGGQTSKGDVDIELLLHGAEKLCTVYPLPGASERISAQRQKHAHQTNTLAYYEAKIAEQQEALARMNRDHFTDDEHGSEEAKVGLGRVDVVTEEDLRREEEEVRELEKKKRELEERLRAMEKDLGGLLNL
ncbi:hypothetical protein VTK73DRAFT_6800 [Phialemonium thermophilum]|uniref:DASH complex subunit SPC34 n=1 Tax=Phialemonium thermophilum TaxID=223376 RepID=A0ABR3Y757_9PEZI